MPTKQPDSGKTDPKRKAAGTRQSKASTTKPKAAPKSGKPRKPNAQLYSNEYRGIPLETLLDRISSGDSVAKIADEIGVTRYALHQWLAHESRLEQYLAAQTHSADSIMDKAEKAILDESLDIARARELANHYRHVAKARNPRRWGDKQQIEMSGELGMRNLTDEQIDAKLQRLLDVSGD